MAIDLNAIAAAAKVVKAVSEIGTDISKEVTASKDATVERKEKQANEEHNRNEATKQNEFERKEKSKTNRINNFTSIISTLSTASDSITKSWDRIIKAKDRSKRIDNEFIIEIKKLEDARKKNEEKLMKALDDSEKQQQQKMKSLDQDHEARMYELEIKRTTALEMINTVRDICLKMIDGLESRKNDGIIDISDYSNISNSISGYLTSINNVPLLFSQNNNALITKDDDE